MNAVEKKILTTEAQMQLFALKKISIWRSIAIAVSTLGTAITYAGLAGTNRHLFLGILGVIIILLGLGCALVFNLGIRNGRRNVEKMLKVLEEGNAI